MATQLGGFNTKFTEDAQEYSLHEHCSLCLLIFREPYQVSCCGKRYCKLCIERVRSKWQQCPNCYKDDFVIFHDKGFQHSLYEVEVYCSEDGCEWKGELGQLESHLNVFPQPDKQWQGCQYVLLKCHCAGCDVTLPRRDMPAHLRQNLNTHTAYLLRDLQDKFKKLSLEAEARQDQL